MVHSTYGGTLKTYKSNTRREFVVQIKYLSCVVSCAPVNLLVPLFALVMKSQDTTQSQTTTFRSVLRLLDSHLSLTTTIIHHPSSIIVGFPFVRPLPLTAGLQWPNHTSHRPIYPTPSPQPSDLGMAP